MAMTKIQLNLAGWLSIILAVTYVPILIITVFMTVQGIEQGIERATGRATEQTTEQNPDILLLNLILGLVCLGLFVYIMIQLKILLNSRFQFHNVDIIILILIVLSIVSTIVSTISLLLLLGGAGTKMVAIILSVVVAILYGIFEIRFAVKILHLSDNLFGLLKPFSYTAMAGGICMVTVILSPLAIIIGIVNYVILGMIFISATEGLSPIGE